MPAALNAIKALIARGAHPGQAVAEVYGTRGKLLAELAGKQKLAEAETPERLLLGAPGALKARAVLADLPVAARWEVAGRPLYDSGVVHYDASGGSAIPDIIRSQREFYDMDKDMGIIPRGVSLMDMLRRGQIRIGDLRQLERATYEPMDPFASSLSPKLNGRPMFYVNEHEGAAKGPGPASVKIRDILNDPDLRRELNLSVAVPERGRFNVEAAVLKARGGLAQYKEYNRHGR